MSSAFPLDALLFISSGMILGAYFDWLARRRFTTANMFLIDSEKRQRFVYAASHEEAADIHFGRNQFDQSVSVYAVGIELSPKTIERNKYQIGTGK